MVRVKIGNQEGRFPTPAAATKALAKRLSDHDDVDALALAHAVGAATAMAPRTNTPAGKRALVNLQLMVAAFRKGDIEAAEKYAAVAAIEALVLNSRGAGIVKAETGDAFSTAYAEVLEEHANAVSNAGIDELIPEDDYLFAADDEGESEPVVD